LAFCQNKQTYIASVLKLFRSKPRVSQLNVNERSVLICVIVYYESEDNQ